MRRYLVLTAVLGTAAAPGIAAADNQLWNAAFIQARPGPTGLTGWLDLHARRREGSTLAILRPAIGWTFSPRLAVHAGYAYIPTITDEGGNRHEQRSWQQVILSHAVPGDGAIKLQLRGRLEQRFGGWDDVGHRVRIFARGQWQVSPCLPVQLVGWDEVFVGVNDVAQGPVSGYDQNRLFLGLGTDTAVRGVRVEAGYLNVDLRGDGPLIHAIAVNLFATIVP